MPQGREGQIVTFYSFKGGTGRTMALANVAWLLASSGRRVLAVDWDLESPGLPRYFNPFLSADAVRDAPGVIDLIREFDTEAARRRKRGAKFDELAAYARVKPYALALNWDFPDGGGLDFMSSGRQNMEYATTIGSLGWDVFYDKLGGGRLFNALRADMKQNYDYTLIDSRTGFGDIADICVKDLPDTLVNCFTLNSQGIEGAVRVALDLEKYRINGTGQRIRVLPVPMRVDDGEKEKADTGRGLARRRFAGLPSDLMEEQRQAYWSNVEIPYRPFYAYEEILAAFGDESAGPTTLLGAYERLTGYVTDGKFASAAPIETALRERWLKRFERAVPSNLSQILLDYGPEDDAWAEWIGRVLASVGVTAVTRPENGEPAPEAPAAPLTLSIVSKFSRGDGVPRPGTGARRDREDGGARRAVYVSDLGPFGEFPASVSESLAGQSAEEAASRLTRLLGCDPVPEDVLRTLRDRFPDNVPKLNNALGRNPRFTGRAKLLRELRDRLRAHHCTALLPDKLPSGVGKTQLAREYVHRYKSEYEVIWWVDCTQPQFVDTDLVDLGRSLNAGYEDSRIPIDAGGAAQDDAAAVAAALAQGSPVRRWLLVFDNAADPAGIRRYIPSGPGHVLITSRNRAWDQAAPSSLEVGVFDRAESVAHLRRRVPDISEADADSLAEALGDLPVAVSLSGAWLSESGTSVPVYVRQLDERGPLAIPEPLDENTLDGYSDRVLATFDNSLDSARKLSRAAHRLLELCSFMSEGGISLGLVYTPAMLDLLSEFDDRLAEPGDIARHVQLLNRLALIRLDNQNRQLTIHRLLHSRIRQRMAAEELAGVRHQVHTLLAQNRPRRGVDDPETWPRYRMLWPHLDPSDAAGCGDEHVRSLMIDRVRYMWMVGSPPETAEAARRIERRWQTMVSKAPAAESTASMRTQLLHLQFNIGNILRDLASYDESWALDTKVLQEQRELLGEEHRHTLMTATGLAADLRARGEYAEALELAARTYEAWRDEYGEDHERTLDAANNLAVSLRLAGRYGQARSLDEATYERRRSSERMGVGHPRTIGTADSLGRDLRETGEYGRSVVWLTELLATARRQNEPSRRAIAQVQVNLAASLRAVGKNGEAEPLLSDAYKTLRELFGEDHPESLICRLCIAAVRHAAEQYEEAGAELRSVLATYRRLVGPSHPLTLVSASNHVALLRSLGESEVALHTARDTAGRLLAVLGGNHPYTLAAQMNYAVCLADTDRLMEARALDERNVPIMTGLLGEEHPDTLRAKANLALNRRALDEQGAAGELNRIIARLEEVLGREHPSVTALRAGRRTHRVLDPQPF